MGLLAQRRGKEQEQRSRAGQPQGEQEHGNARRPRQPSRANYSDMPWWLPIVWPRGSALPQPLRSAQQVAACLTPHSASAPTMPGVESTVQAYTLVDSRMIRSARCLTSGSTPPWMRFRAACRSFTSPGCPGCRQVQRGGGWVRGQGSCMSVSNFLWDCGMLRCKPDAERLAATQIAHGRCDVTPELAAASLNRGAASSAARRVHRWPAWGARCAQHVAHTFVHAPQEGLT